MWDGEGQRQQSEAGQRNHSLCKTEGNADTSQAVRISGHGHSPPRKEL